MESNEIISDFQNEIFKAQIKGVIEVTTHGLIGNDEAMDFIDDVQACYERIDKILNNSNDNNLKLVLIGMKILHANAYEAAKMFDELIKELGGK